MKICSKKDIKIITGIMAASMLLGGCTKTAEEKKPQIKADVKAKQRSNLTRLLIPITIRR